MALLGILFLIVGLLVSVGLHELGHLIPAKRFGAKVSHYFIGFGPTLWSTYKNGTEYGIKAIPLGGFVRISGMLSPGRASRRTVGSDGKPTMAEEARQQSAAELEEGEESQAFWRLSVPKRVVVMFSGPFVNLLLAALCMAVVMCGIGSGVASNQLSAVQACVTTSSECTDSDPVSPASAAGLQAGDEIVSWGGVAVSDWADIQREIADGGTESAPVVVVRDGEELTLTVQPVETERPQYDSDGNAVTDDDGNAVTASVPYVGISPAYALERQSITSVPGSVWSLATGTAAVVARLPMELWNTGVDLVTGADRSTSGVIGIVGVADVAGSITSVQSDQYTLVARIGDLLMLIGSLNMSLFIFNLIPLLPLDGGHILGALYEGVRRQFAKLRGRPDPGPVDMARALPLSYAVAVFFVLMTVFLVVADIVSPVI